MRAGRLFRGVALIVVLALVPAAAPAQIDEAVVSTVDTDTLLGGLAAIGCGVFVRATLVTAGTQVATIIGAVACCSYMLLDLTFFD